MSLFHMDTYFDGRVKVITPPIYKDERGFVSVTFLENEMESLGLPKFVRELHSRSQKGVVRGLHYQLDPPMSKLMRVTRGSAYMVAVDIYPYSPTFLQFHEVVATEENQIQVWASADFARGFLALEDKTEVQYKCSAYHNPEEDKAIFWRDAQIGIPWSVGNPILSERDLVAPTIKEILERI
jgi:dTDP-4-dehydrorhamnose 3,5-epimerase